MKYDTGMTHLHGDILAAVRLMLYHDTEITKKFSPSDGSPAPLREYLKNGFKHSGKWCDEARYDCNSTGMEISFERPLNNEGDQKLRLSWSQLAVFIRNNWDAVFIGELDFPCDGCGYDKNGCCNYPETKDDYCVLGDKNIPAESVPPTVGESQTTKPESVSPTVGETQTAFDYSRLSDFEANKLRSCEQTIKQETVGYFTILGAKFKEAQELLSKYGSGEFECWYTMLGFKRQTVYSLIQRYDFICSPTVGGRSDVIEGLPLTLSYEISKPSALPELVQRVLDGDITTNAEYQKLKKELETTRQKLDEVNRENIHVAKQRSDMYEKCAALEAQIEELEKCPAEKVEVVPDGYLSPEEHAAEIEAVKSESEKRNKKLLDENIHLKHLSGAEKRGQLANEIEDLKKQLDKQKSESKKAWGELAKANYEIETNGIALEQARKEKADLESKIKALEDNPPEAIQTQDGRIKHFLLNITIEDMEKLIELVENSSMPLISGAVKNAILLNI